MAPSVNTKKAKTSTLLIERLPKFLFPPFLLVLQLILRSMGGDNSFFFVGPALAAAGAGLVVALTSHRGSRIPVTIPDEIENFINNNGLVVDTVNARIFRIWALIISATLTLIWAGTVKLSLDPLAPPVQVGGITIQMANAQFILGLLCYIIGIGFSELKEFV
jgi:hypothetical protein